MRDTVKIQTKNGKVSTLEFLYTDTHFRVLLDYNWVYYEDSVQFAVFQYLAEKWKETWPNNPEYHVEFLLLSLDSVE